MCVAREARRSEKVFSKIWGEMKSLNNCVWYGKGLRGQAQSTAKHICTLLQELINTLDEEKDTP